MSELTKEQQAYYQRIELAIKKRNNVKLVHNLVQLEKTGEIIKNIKSPEELNLLQYILQERFFDGAIIKWLLSKGVSPDVVIKGVPALLYCIGEEEIEAAMMLLRYGANIDCYNEHKQTPLMWAIELGQEELFYLCLENNADIYFEDNAGNNALIWAVRNIREKEIKMLTKGFLRPCDAEKLLIEAATNSSKEIFEHLLKAANSPYFSSQEFLKKLKEIASKNDNDEITNYINHELKNLDTANLILDANREGDEDEGDGMDWAGISPPPLATIGDNFFDPVETELLCWDE